MADRIRLLPEVVANQIAAGEVVNRPASVVKEMMENAIDAGATEVKVNFRDGGRELIQIVDNGCGMSPIDARMAFDRHATSKISSVEDIYALHTFGFRGEALASIAAVAQVELRTRQEGDELGTRTEINGGVFASQTPVACPVGAQFFVRNLFYNVPARRRFLDKSTTSSNQIRTEFQRVALCNPKVAFELYANDAPVYRLGAATLATRIVDVIGRHIKQNLLEVSAETSIASVSGYIGRPAAAKKRNTEQYLFVNGRYFKSSYLYNAVMKAYEKLIPENCSPSYFLYLTVDPARVDVNVHPQKTEVKFADEEAVWQIVNAAVRETLAKTGAVPMMDFDSDQTVEIPVLRRGALYSEPPARSNLDYNPFREEYIDPSAPDPNEEFTGFDVPYTAPDSPAGVADSAAAFVPRGAMPSGRAAVGTMPYGGGAEESDAAPWRNMPLGGSAFAGEDSSAEEFDDIVSPSELGGLGGADDAASELEFVSSSVGEQQQLSFAGAKPVFGEAFPLAGGCAAALYGGRLVVVDLRRARERVLYEYYLSMLNSGSAASQQLLFPEHLLLSSEEYALLEENAVEVAALGFDLEYGGDGAVEVKGLPAEISAEGVDVLLYELLQVFDTPVDVAALRREKMASVMVRGAMKRTSAAFSKEETRALLDRLAACDSPCFSPSGKHIMSEFTSEDIRSRLG